MSIKNFQSRQPLEADHLNALVNACNSVYPLTGNNGINVTHMSSGGAVVALPEGTQTIYTPIMGQITNAGPAAEADFSDYRYWVQCLWNVNTPTTNPTDKTLDIQDKNAGTKIVAAFNLQEYVDESHGLAVGSYVIILPVRFDRAITAESVTRYVIVQGGGSLPIPQLQGMVIGAITQNQLGAFFLFATDIP